MNKIVIGLISMVALLSAAGMGATYYLENGGTGTGDVGDPWGSFQEALNEMPDGSHTVSCAAGTYTGSVTITSNTNGSTINFTPVGVVNIVPTASPCISVGSFETIDVNVTFTNINFQCSVAGAAIGLQWSGTNTACSLTFSGCTFTPHADNTTFALVSTSNATGVTTRSLTYSDACTLTTKGDIDAITLLDIETFTLDGNTINVAGTATTTDFIRASGDVGDYTINNNTVTMNVMNSGGYVFYNSSLTSVGKFEFTNNTITGGGSVYLNTFTGIPYSAYIINNTLNQTSGGFWVGNDSGTVAYDFTYVMIKDNTIDRSNTSTGHGCFVRTATATPIYIVNNTLDMTDDADEYGIVVKSFACSVEDNWVKALYPICVKGGQNVLLKHNTAKCTVASGAALYLLNQPDVGGGASEAHRLTIVNNVFDGGVGAYAVKSDNPTTYPENIFDNNVYYAGATGLFYDGAAKTLAEWKTYWGTNGTTVYSKVNDAHSLAVNPLIDPATGYSRNAQVIELGAGRRAPVVVKKGTLGPQLYDTLGNTQ